MESRIELTDVPLGFPSRSASTFPTLHIYKCQCEQERMHESCSPSCLVQHIKQCPQAHYWSHLTKIITNHPTEYSLISSVSKDTHQINLDLSRTYPDVAYFNSETGSRTLSHILNKVANYVEGIGYVQGMNYICAALLWHTTEENAFWLFIQLMSIYKLRENFEDGLPGLMNHCSKMEGYVSILWPEFSAHLEGQNVIAGMFMTDWCITLYCNVIPLNKIGRFFMYFFEEGWDYFYKLSLEILGRLRKRIMKMDDRLDILTTLKPFQLFSDHQKRFLESITNGLERKNWSNVLNAAKKRKLPDIL